MRIDISVRSQELIYKIHTLLSSPPEGELPASTSLDLPSFLSWFDKSPTPSESSKKGAQELNFLLMELRIELLHDLCAMMEGEDMTPEAEHSLDKVSLGERVKFIFLSIAGVLVAACEGFDSMVTVLSIFSLPASVILGCGLMVSFFSTIAFCGFNRVKLASSLGIKLSDAHKALDLYVRQLEEIKQIRKKIAAYNLAKLSLEELNELQQIIGMSKHQFQLLAAAKGQFEQFFNHFSVQIAKGVLSAIAASLFFGGGFCAGQTVSLYVLGFLTAATLTPASWPVIICSLIVGGAAFSLYWCVEFPGLKALISGWFGLNEKKVATLCDAALFAKEEKKLSFLDEHLASTYRLKEQIPAPQNESSSASLHKEGQTMEPPKTGSNIYSFLRPKKTTSPMPYQEREPDSNMSPNVLGTI